MGTPALMGLLFLLASGASDEEGGLFPLVGGFAGVSWDSNVTRSEKPQGDVALDVGASGGGGWVSEDGAWGVSLLGLYRGRAWATAIELSTHVLGGSLLGTWSPLEWLALGVAPSGGYTLGVDSSRNGPRLDARGFVKVFPTEWLSVRAGYGYLWRDAVDAVFSTRTHDVSALVVVRPLDWLGFNASVGYAAGDDVVYQATEASGGLAGTRRRRFSAAGASYEPLRVYAHTVSMSAGAEFLLPRGFSLSVDVAWVSSVNEVQPWTAWVPSALVGWDLP
ncbi:MAG: hypothetical protein AB1938_32050 [Myxococcota bacterium]